MSNFIELTHFSGPLVLINTSYIVSVSESKQESKKGTIILVNSGGPKGSEGILVTENYTTVKKQLGI